MWGKFLIQCDLEIAYYFLYTRFSVFCDSLSLHKFFMYACNIQHVGSSSHRGGTRGIHLQRFVQALEDPASGLTYSALTGVRKL